MNQNAPSRVEQELDRAGADVADGPRHRDRRLAHAPAQRRRQTAGEGASSMIFWCRRCTEQSRSPRWIVRPCASAKTWISTWRAPSTARSSRRRRVAEGRRGLRRGRLERRVELAGLAHQAHAAAAAAGRGLDHDRKADPRRFALQQGRVLRRRRRSPAAPARRRAAMRRRASDLSAIARIASGGGPIQTQAGRFHRLGEAGVLAQEAVARMHGRGARRPRRRDDAVDAQVGIGGALAADRDRPVGDAGVRRVAVGIGGDRDRFDAEPARRARDPDGDLAAVGDQDRAQHRASAPARGRVCMYLAMMPSITSSAPPAIEPSRPSR